MIRITGLTKRFGKLEVLRGVELRVRRGRITAIVGPNGSGKTSLIKTILGLVKPDAGDILLEDRALNGDSEYRNRIGYMPQGARFPENLSGAEIIHMLEDLRRVEHEDRELLDRFRLNGELSKPIRTLSGGTRQKVNAVIAFLFDPDLIILDEPTAGLDPIASALLKDKIRQARAAGKTFVLTSHIMSEVEELADDIVFLLDGRVRFQGTVQELKSLADQSNLERAVAELMMREESAA